MKKLIVGGLAALAIGLVAAPVAEADDYTTKDLEFVASVAGLGYYDAPHILIDTAHEVCGLLEQDAVGEPARAFVIRRLSVMEFPDFNATLFVQYSAIAYCPWQPAAHWNI